jgi:hypothetical protein
MCLGPFPWPRLPCILQKKAKRTNRQIFVSKRIKEQRLMTSGSAWIAIFSIGALFAVSGCEEFEGIKPKPESSEAASEGQVQSVMQDVERSDIFSTTEAALWDGRPSLGGIWVAHPDVTEPERALIRNPKSGQEIAGALFRRERDNPGPRIQLSSDAAAALGILAGQPTELSVVAVRQEEVIIEPAPVISEEAIGDDGAPVDGAARVDDSGADGSSAEDAALAGAAGATAATQAPKRQGFWSRFRDSLRNKPKEPAAAAVSAQGSAGDAATAPPAVETKTLDPVTTAAAAAIATAEASDKPRARPETTQASAPAAKPAASALKNPFVQVGLYSSESNANDAGSTLRQAGIVPTIVPGNDRWRVVVGPMATPDDQAALLGRIRSLGFSDAFLSPN